MDKGGKGKGGKGPSSFQALYKGVKGAGILGGGTVPNECQVHIAGLPEDTTDEGLYKLFAPFGAIAPTGVKAMPNADHTGCKGVGFADFVDPTAAATAVMSLNGFAMPDGSTLNVSIKAEGGGGGGKKGGGKGKARMVKMARANNGVSGNAYLQLRPWSFIERLHANATNV